MTIANEPKEDVQDLMQRLGESIGAYGLECAETKELAPSAELKSILDETTNLIESLSAQLSDLQDEPAYMPAMEKKLEDAEERAEQAEQDAMTMTMRLMGEDEDSFGPECYEVMKRWKPKALELLRDAALKGGKG